MALTLLCLPPSSQVKTTTTHLNLALIGKTFYLSNSTWSGQSGGKSACKIVGYARELNWASGSAPALVVQTTDDGFNYAFQPRDILKTFGAVARYSISFHYCTDVCSV